MLGSSQERANLPVDGDGNERKRPGALPMTSPYGGFGMKELILTDDRSATNGRKYTS